MSHLGVLGAVLALLLSGAAQASVVERCELGGGGLVRVLSRAEPSAAGRTFTVELDGGQVALTAVGEKTFSACFAGVYLATFEVGARDGEVGVAVRLNPVDRQPEVLRFQGGLPRFLQLEREVFALLLEPPQPPSAQPALVRVTAQAPGGEPVPQLPAGVTPVPALPHMPAVLVSPADAGAEVVASWFPAVSPDGRQVAYLSTRSRYDESWDEQLHLVASTGAVRRFPLTATTAVSTADAPELHLISTPASAVAANVTKAAAAVLAGHFVALTPRTLAEERVTLLEPDGTVADVGPWRVRWEPSSRRLSVARVERPTQVLTSRVVGLSWPAAYSCEPQLRTKAGCMATLTWLELWGDERVLFITAGNNQGPDGTEDLREYLTIWPEQGRWVVQENAR